MKRAMTIMMLAGLMAVSVQAVSDDSTPASSTASSAQNDKAMKDCMAKQKASNASMTQDAMQTVCKNEVRKKGQKDGNDLATGTQAPKPQS